MNITIVPPVRTTSAEVIIRPLQRADLNSAQHVFRLAFGTFLRLPDAEQFSPDRDFVGKRWQSDPSRAWVATVDGRLAGSILATGWGSFSTIGPVTVHPDFWDRGIATRLLEPALARLEAWGSRHAGLFTFPNSPKHHGLYQKFGFWPRFLTAVMTKPIEPGERNGHWTAFSQAETGDRPHLLAECRELTGSLFEGLDLTEEVRAVEHLQLGETVLLWDGDRLAGFAVCHCGAGTEAGADTAYVKFAGVRSSLRTSAHFVALLDACETMAATRGLKRIEAGVNLARHEAYRALLAHGFRAAVHGVAMHRPNEPGYSRPGMYVLDDWR